MKKEDLEILFKECEDEIKKINNQLTKLNREKKILHDQLNDWNRQKELLNLYKMRSQINVLWIDLNNCKLDKPDLEDI